jgi:hypothetical protein
MANNGATLMLDSKGHLPRADARGNASTAPHMDLMGALVGAPSTAVEAGDVRANENIGLTAVHTLFAREHNRIVGLLPSSLSAEDKFQIARRVVGAEEQYITYNEFLPSLGVRPAGTYSPAQLAAFTAEGIVIETAANGDVTLVIPLALAFGNPDPLEQVGEGPILASLAGESQYKNDEQIDNSLRSVLFRVPKPGSTQPCEEPVIDPDCFTDVSDLGAIDIQRAYGVTYRYTLAQLIKLDSGATVQPNAFRVVDASQPAPHEQRLHGHRRAHPPYAFGPPGRH